MCSVVCRRRSSMNTSHTYAEYPVNKSTTMESTPNKITMPQSSPQTTLAILHNSDKGRSTIHGDSYHLRVAMMIILRAYRMYQLDNDFCFLVAVEVAAAGKFDDILFHFSSPALGSGTMFIQAKHKQFAGRVVGKASNRATVDVKQNGRLKQAALCTAWDSNASFSIPMYFVSFLEIDQHLPNDARYVLCTNAGLDGSIERYATIINPQQDNALLFCADIGATCYQFAGDKPFVELIDTLKDSCFAKLGKVFAGSIFAGKTVTFNDTLIDTFDSFIMACLVPQNEETSDRSVITCRFNEDFFNADDTTPAGKFRAAFQKEYKSLFVKGKLKQKDNILHELEIKIDRDSLTSATNTREDEIFAKFDEKVLEFYDKFLLVCNSSNEEDLRIQAMSLLPRWCDTERGTVFDKLQGVLLDALKSPYPVPLDLTFIQRCFLSVELAPSITSLKSFSGEYIKSVRVKHHQVEIDQERLKSTSLYMFLDGKAGCLVYEFYSSLDQSISAHILLQVLALFKHETLFVDSAKYAAKQEMIDILEDLLSYLKDVNHPTAKVVTVLGKYDHNSIDEFKKLSEKFCYKIVVVAKASESPPKDVSLLRFAVKDLTHEAANQLYKQTDSMIFGTVSSLSGIVDNTDDLSFLIAVLKFADQTMGIKDHQLNVFNYEKIKHWYIHRRIVPYEWSISKRHSVHRFYPNMKEIELAIASCNAEPDPPGIEPGSSSNAKVHILLNDAGYGKTSYLTWLAWHLSVYDRTLYVIKFIANEYSTDFERLEGSELQSLSDTEIVRLLYRYIHLALFVPNVNKRTIKETDLNRDEADRCAKLLTVSNGQIVLDVAAGQSLSTIELIELRLFREKFNQRKLLLILDGFDEIAPYYKDVVMDCFARFARLDGVRSLYLSSRPYGLEEDLRTTFTSCSMYQLEPFSRENIILALYKFLVSDLDDYKNWEEAHRIDVLRDLFYSIIVDVTHALTVPLLLYMVLVILLPEIKTRVDKHSHRFAPTMFNNAKFGIFQLVQRFIDRKITILYIDKTGTTDAAVKTATAKKNLERLRKYIKKRHMLLAVCALFDGHDREALLSSKEQDRALESMEEVINGDEKTGLVLGVLGERPQFVHRIFAEFFTACWLSANRTRFRQERIFQSQSLWTPALKQTRNFFDCLIVSESKGCNFHWALVNHSTAQVVKLLRETPSAVTVKDKVGRLPLHLVEYVCTDNILQKLPSELVNEPDELFGWNALDYAFVLNERTAIHCLLQKGAKLNADTAVFQQLCSNDSDELLQQGIRYVSYLERYDHPTGMAKRLCERVARYMIHERKVDIYSSRVKLNSSSMLEYCVQEHNVLMLSHIVRQSGEPCQVLGRCADRLLAVSLQEEAYSITNYLLEQRVSLLTQLHRNGQLVGCAKRAIEKNQVELFRQIFHELCIRLKISCADETDIIDELDVVQCEGEIPEFKILVKYCCCSKGYEYGEQFKLFDKYDQYDAECFLATVLDVGSVSMISYVLQKLKMDVTKALIMKLIKLLPFFKRSSHNKSIPAFKCLLNRMIDLYHVDQDGQTLLDTIVQDGCLYMIQCLIDKGFEAKQINYKHLTGLLTNYGKYYAANLFVYLQQKSYVDFFKAFHPTGESIFDVIIYKGHFLLAQALIQAQFGTLLNSEKENVMMDLLEEMLLKYGVEHVLDMLNDCHKNSASRCILEDKEWHLIYSSIRKKIPIV
ncbi:uncharacterized protein LOC118504728 isoform X2 [Anopheles stephensi]|uniref:uncharacterized protein LOC118504728 isoform X2 n=1 Tax=Anopheles stephensi TaxID=30069 RepID=UPI001658C363|nr:uncharacterized protein LOC118504728 isoform X2 [Anopheles stephensi]